MNTTIQQLHALFCHETGQTLRLGLGEYTRERFWHDFIKAGFTADDLRLVIRHIRKGILAGDRRPGALRFSNLIERLELFEEQVSMARAAERNSKPQPTPREDTLAAFRRTPQVVPQTPAKKVGDYIAAMRKAIQ